MEVSVPTRATGISLLAKTLLGVFAVLSVLGFLVVAELGVNAGRVHYGVTVGGIGIGGLTQAEARSRLRHLKADDPLKDRMKSTPIVFTRRGLKLSVTPEQVGWRADPAATARRAMRVGREGLWSSITERARAWFGGEAVAWVGSPRAAKVTRLLNAWQKEIRSAGFVFTGKDRAKLRFKLRWRMSTWPRTFYRIPVSGR